MSENQNNHVFDLEERTAKFGEDVLSLCKKIKITVINESIIKQIIRSATSVGANYMEANGACSKKDFLNKIYICKKESQETKHWLRMLLVTQSEENTLEIKRLWQEAYELACIFHKIATTTKE